MSLLYRLLAWLLPTMPPGGQLTYKAPPHAPSSAARVTRVVPIKHEVYRVWLDDREAPVLCHARVSRGPGGAPVQTSVSWVALPGGHLAGEYWARVTFCMALHQYAVRKWLESEDIT